MTEICIKPIDDTRAKIVDCKTGAEVDICGMCGKGGRARGKRAPSPYNIFMGSCVKGKSGDIKTRFKACVEEWKKKK